MANAKYVFSLISRRKISPQNPIMLAAGSHLFKGKSSIQKLPDLASPSLYQASWLWLSNRSAHAEVMASYVFPPSPPPPYSAAAQHLRMQNEQASETVAMVIVTRLIVTRILIKAHTATRLLGRPSRWKQQQLMASLLNRVSGCTLFLTSWRCLTDSCTRHCLYFMHREHAWCFLSGGPQSAAKQVMEEVIPHCY